MSQDAAFTVDNNTDEVFQFADEQSAQDSQTKNDNTRSASISNEDTDGEVDEQRVPYSRFKRVIEEREEVAERMKALEERLQSYEDDRRKSEALDVPMPPEWEKLYGNSDASKEAWQIQLQREEQLAERAVQEAVVRLQKQQEALVDSVQENEELIDASLESLQATLGKKFTQKQEEEILSIVDEFSPVGDDGKYVTLFPFEKAYEIYALRNEKRSRPTQEARRAVAGLANGSSEGDAETSTDSYRRGWDNWREAL